MLLVEAKIKYLGVKFKKGLKKREIAAAGIIKDANDLCVRILLYLLCFKAKELEKIDVDELRSSIDERIGDGALLDNLDYLKEKNILDYKYEKADAADYKGANMDKIASLIGNICDNINNMSEGKYKEPEATQEQIEFERIYRLDKSPRIIESGQEETIKFEKIELEKTESYDIAEPEISMEEAEKNNISKEDYNVSAEDRNERVTIETICEELEKNMEFRDLYEDVQNKLHAIINPHELEIIFNLYNRMESELLLKIAEYCGEKSGKNPKSAVNYFEKTALGLCNDGIVTAKQYDEYIESAKKVSEYEVKIRKIFGLGDKKLSAKERGFIKVWATEYNFSDEMIIEGFNKAVNVNKATIPYINAIYLSWHEKGFKNTEDIKSEFNKNTGAKKSDPEFNSEQFFEKLVRKSLKF